MSGSNIWDQVLARIETKVNRHSFYTWFKPTAFVAERAGTIRVRVPNALFRDWLTKHYAAVIEEALTEVQRPGAPVAFVTDDLGEPLVPTVNDVPPPDPEPEEEPVDDLGILSPRYSFDTFIVGTSNQFAHAASRGRRGAVALLQSAVHLRRRGTRQDAPDARHRALRRHASQESATDLHLVRALHERDDQCPPLRSHPDFRERYRSVDVLLVDDVQFLAGKEGTQTEFFHTFNALYDSQKQIVISSDCPPHEIPQLEERLRSRFEWG